MQCVQILRLFVFGVVRPEKVPTVLPDAPVTQCSKLSLYFLNRNIVIISILSSIAINKSLRLQSCLNISAPPEYHCHWAQIHQSSLSLLSLLSSSPSSSTPSSISIMLQQSKGCGRIRCASGSFA